MILTTHILTGAVLGASVKNPYVVAGLAIALHFVLDVLPHGDYLNKNSKIKEFWKVAIDLATGFGCIFAFFASQGLTLGSDISTNIGVGIFFSLLPDGTTLLYMGGANFLKPLKHFHESLHFYANDAPERQFHFKNNLWDIAISLISLIILISLLR